MDFAKNSNKKDAFGEKSFSARVKEEISENFFNSDGEFEQRASSKCCKKARSYGILQCGRAFSPRRISLKTENYNVAEIYSKILTELCGLSAEQVVTEVGASGFTLSVADFAGGFNVSDSDGATGRGALREESDAGPDKLRIAVLEQFGHSEREISLRINRANFECEGCLAAYLSGAFLACGSISDPACDYHMELSIPYYKLANDMLALMRELGLNARLVERKGNFIIYLKESTQIEDCLTLIGAVNASLELMNVKIIKDIRNKVNRITNCESANISKTVDAALKQLNAITIIRERDGLGSLPDDLRELAVARVENPDMSLRELGELMSPPLSRSGANHRLNRIIKWADELSGK